MRDCEFDSRIGELQRRIVDLQQRAIQTQLQGDVLVETLEQMRVDLDALAGAEQTFRQQNEELTAACRAAEKVAGDLARERDLFRAIAEHTHTHLAYLDADFSFVWVNPAYAQGSGRSEEELVGQNHFELFPDPENQAIFEQVRRTGHPVRFAAKPFEYADQPERGTTYWDWALVPVNDDSGQIQGLVLSLLDVTERKRAEESLEEQNQFILNVFESLAHPFYVLDANDYTVMMSNSATRRSEVSETVTCYALTHGRTTPCDDDAELCPLEEIKRTRKPVVVEHAHLGHEGDSRIFEVHGHPILDSGGNVTQIIEYALDITERKGIEEALEASKERYRLLVETMAEGLAVIGKIGEITYVNEKFCEMLGYSRDELIGRKLLEVVDSEREEMHQNEFLKRRRGESNVYETTLQQRDGEKLPVILSESPLSDRDGSFNGFFGVFTDITAYKQAQAALQRERDFISAILDTAGALVVVLDRQGRIVRFNRACEDMTGYSFHEVAGKFFWDLFVIPEEVEPVKTVFKELQAGQFRNKHENYWVTRGGKRRLIAWSNSALLDDLGAAEYIIGTGIDITERRQTQEALREALHQSQQREAEISALLEGARAVLRYRNFETAARSIFDSCKHLTGATGGYVAFLADDGVENELLFLDSGGAECTVDPTLPMPIRGLREEAYRTGKTVFENNFHKSEWVRFLPKGHLKLENVLFAPLVINGIAAGLLGLANKPGGFTESDARIASGFSELAAIALLNSRALESLENSEARFRSVAQSASEAIITINRSGNIVFWNRAAVTLFGYSEDEVRGRPLTFLMPEHFRAAHQKGVERFLSTGKPRILGKLVEMVGLGKDGSEFPIELSVATWKTGEEVFFSGIIRDIAERKRAEEALRRSERELRVRNQINRIFLTYPDERMYSEVLKVIQQTLESEFGTFGYFDENGSFVAPALSRQIFWEKCEVPEKEIIFQKGTFSGIWARAIQERKTLISNDGPFDTPEGHIPIRNTMVTPVIFRGEVISAIHVANKSDGYDTEDREMIETIADKIAPVLYARLQRDRQNKARERAQERLHFQAQLLDSVRESVVATDLEGRVTFWGKGAEALYGFRAGEVLGEPLMSVVEPHNTAKAEARLQQVLETGSWSGQYVQRNKDGTSFWAETFISLVADEQGQPCGLIGIDRDITDRVRAEQEIRSLAKFPSENCNPVLRISQDGTILYANEASRPLLTAWTRQVGQKLPDAWQNSANDAISSGESRTAEVNFEDRIFSVDLAPITEGGYVNLYCRDITERVRAEKRAEERTRELSTLLEISRHVALTLELEPLLDLILDQLRAVVDYDKAIIFKFENKILTALAQRGTSPQEDVLELTIPVEDAGLAHRMVFSQERIIIPDIQDDTPLARAFHDVPDRRFEAIYSRTRSWMGVPLTIKDQTTGILTLQHSEPDHFSPNQVELVLGFANQAAVAIENTRLYEQAQELAAIEERQRLARDLHDAVSQTLFSASLAAEVLPRLWERQPDEGRRCLKEIQQLTRGALAEMRTLLLELRPAALLEIGLADLLSQLVEAASSRARIPIALDVEGQGLLAPEVQVNLYRIAQEGLNNMVKHAGARQAAVSLRFSPRIPAETGGGQAEKVELRIEDDGTGFDLDGVPADCLGLRIMTERAKGIGAAIGIDSQIGHGTQLAVVWPEA